MCETLALTQETFTQCWYNVNSRLRHWLNIVPILGECLVFAGLYPITAVKKCYVERAVPCLLGVRCREHVFAGFYLLISPPLIPYTLGAFSQRWGNVLKST